MGFSFIAKILMIWISLALLIVSLGMDVHHKIDTHILMIIFFDLSAGDDATTCFFKCKGQDDCDAFCRNLQFIGGTCMLNNCCCVN
ncbi:hypothetical protein DCAR_0832978 [Daucus carota subsp. sativus]|uniref:Knottin scorpion toxin-like domain-containing protein n=1 Tax=Daucus carota subsp. sativus TaxID=79200 RepID=A0AAF0XSM3_DAUCS|nr:hypothetical protein DCAR_0832978 [Daucus carota subsp. sativus]